MAKTEKPPIVFVSVQIPVHEDMVRSLLCSAFESGSKYWYANLDYKYGKGYKAKDFAEGGKMQNPEDYWHPCQIVPLVEGCAVVIEDVEDDNKKHELNRAKLITGMQVMAEKYPHQFKSIMEDDTDAETGDVYLQCCLFGEILYS